ncbi:hypothetical protein CPB84DRAFT_1782777 [Gymnopilus junonius]|uniref:Uncharacterized protein n=1 Tax=Gymnopilus junonius TaxID=109634 RepID=A0A9P5NMP5_GYMJU|nr:hypothetical protein CPB84DRAFT_1782777 [Gymnopilus junonius]
MSLSASLFRRLKVSLVRPTTACPRVVQSLPFIRCHTTDSSLFPRPKEYKVLLDHQTLYISQELAEALGWQRTRSTEPVELTLSGWEPAYFVITPTGTDSERLARSTVESSQNENVREFLKRLQ